VVDIREGFRIRGMGFSAAVIAASPANVTEAFDFPNIQVVDPFSVSDATGDNDGFPEPGEAVTLSVSITNTTGAAVTNVQVNVTGGGSANLGTVNNGQTVQANLSYTVPGGAVCGAMHDVTINASSDVGAQSPVVKSFRLGAPVGGAPVTFSNTTSLSLGPDAGASVPYGTTVNVSGLSGNKIVKLEIPAITHTFPADIDMLLVGPAGQKFMAVSDSGGGGDVTSLAISFTDTAAALPSTSQWAAGTFRPHNVDTTTDLMPAPAPAAPYENPAPAGSATFASALGTDGAALNGTWTLYVRDDANVDGGTMAGWKLTFEGNDYVCSLAAAGRGRADFDGDGKTDVSIFRGSEGNWWINRSTGGLLVLQWGIGSDSLVPEDFDGDGKADTAIFRGTADSVAARLLHPQQQRIHSRWCIMGHSGRCKYLG
jgi:subtilisin-like proprotein convertase family protein